jgi:branched-chain amino acid transport system substrate-binding protein
VVAARMVVEDAGSKVLGRPVEILVADHQGKADVGASIARQWFDTSQVDVAIEFDNSSVALAVEQVAAQKNRIAIAGAVATMDFTGRNCTPNEAAWLHDAYALTTTLARSVVGRGGNTWFFISVDYAFGHSMEAEATRAVVASGGKVLGSARHPLNTADFSSYLLRAQASGAKVVAMANAGGDLINAIKQANEFGLKRAGQTIISRLTFITDGQHGAGSCAGFDLLDGILLGPRRREPSVVEAVLRATQANADQCSGRRERLIAIEPRLPELGRGKLLIQIGNER